MTGRWLSPDPYGQYHSPYVGMGNDWPNGVDEDGGLFGLGSFASSLVGTGIGFAGGAALGWLVDKENRADYVLAGFSYGQRK